MPNKFFKAFPSKFTKVIVWCGIVISAILSVISFFLTSNITSYSQNTVQVVFAPYIIIGILIFFAVLLIPALRQKISKLSLKKVLIIVLVWSAVASVSWVFISNVQPVWDSLDLTYAAEYLNGSADPHAVGKWSTGTYVDHFPFQIPLVMFIAFLQHIAGDGYLIVFQLLNCVACVVTIYFVVRLTELFFKNRTATAFSGLLAMLFLPLFFYCTFIYGNVLCLPFVFATWYYQKKAIDSKSKRAICISVACGTVACLFKPTMIIPIIASAIIWILWGIKTKRVAPFIIGIITVVLANCAIYPFYALINIQHQKDFSNRGVPSIAWITMGIGGGKEYEADISQDESLRTDLTAPGTYDTFVWSLKNKAFSPEKMTELSQTYLQKRIEHFQKDPGFAVNFFANKLAKSWTEPTYESILANNWCVERSVNNYSACKRDHNFLARSVFYGETNHVVTFILDCLQTIIAISLLAALISLRKRTCRSCNFYGRRFTG